MLLLVEDHIAVIDLAGGDLGDAGPADAFLAGAVALSFRDLFKTAI